MVPGISPVSLNQQEPHFAMQYQNTDQSTYMVGNNNESLRSLGRFTTAIYGLRSLK